MMRIPRWVQAVAMLAAVALALAACASQGTARPARSGRSSSTRGRPAPGRSITTHPAHLGSVRRPAAPAHTVIVMMENHSYGEVIGNPAAPFINGLARRGALFTRSYAVTHPSQPNYLALFSGSTQGVSDDSCPFRFTTANLGSQLLAAHDSFTGYAEGLPPGAPMVCNAGEYARKHAPWINFTTVPATATKPMSAFPAGNYSQLPTVSFVIPNLCHDMHDCPPSVGDAWLKASIGPYAAWALTHRSLLIVDWDENDGSPGNHIPTVFVGQMVRPGRYSQHITHYSVLRTIESLYRLPALGAAAHARPIVGIWK